MASTVGQGLRADFAHKRGHFKKPVHTPENPEVENNSGPRGGKLRWPLTSYSTVIVFTI